MDAKPASATAAKSFLSMSLTPPLGNLYDNGQLTILFPGLVFRPGLDTRRIQAEDAAALFHSRLDPFLELVLRRGLGGDFLGHLRRDDDDALLVADHHVAGIDRDAAAAD